MRRAGDGERRLRVRERFLQDGIGDGGLPPPVTFTFDGSTLINLALLLAVLGITCKLGRDVAAT